MGTPTIRVAGIVLAAGSGTRAGGPKALRRGADGVSWLERATHALRTGGCDDILVVLGAEADRARALVPPEAALAVAPDWAEGLSASLRAGLAAAPVDATAALLTLVDLPTMPPEAVERMLAAPVTPASLRRASYAGRPGHPVLIGRDHWSAAAATAEGDRGAGRYLTAQGAESVDCSDLWDGADEDGADEDAADEDAAGADAGA
jgi:CTP:molybdopterin cytidylyltransferase MocA